MEHEIHWQDLSIRFFTELLQEIKESDTNYDKRYSLILTALSVAQDMGYASGIRIDPSEPEWPIVYIELPTGQVSWHMPQHGEPWDGHTTAEKYARIDKYIESQQELIKRVEQEI